MKLVLGRQNPTFSVVAVQLRADITYSKATVSVIIDERGLNKYARDYVNEIDQITIAASKLLETSQSVDDSTSYALSKAVSDTLSTTEVVTRYIGYNREYSDGYDVSDAVETIGVGKNLIHQIVALDTLTRALEKVLADTVVVVDNADANSGDGLEYTDVKPSSDLVGASDLAVTALNKALADAVALTEALQQVVTKVLADAATATEQAFLELGRPVADSVTATELLDRIFDAVRAYSDSVSHTETLAFDSTKSVSDTYTPTDSFDRVFTANLAPSDSQSVADSYVFDGTKVQADSAAATEVFERIFQANLTVSDSILTLDALASIGVEKLLTDAISAVSAGSLRMTDYADITYFAEDYVGTSTTFS